MSARRQKQALVAAFNYLFIGAVCREWQTVYAGIGDQKVLCLHVMAKDTGAVAMLIPPCTALLFHRQRQQTGM
jgi:hypothetical protein